MKVLIGDEAEEFEEVVVDEGNPILPDMHLDPSETHIYAASPYKVSSTWYWIFNINTISNCVNVVVAVP